MAELRDAVIVDARRTAVGKAGRGALASQRPDDLAAAVIRDLVVRNPALDPATIDDVILGCAIPEAQQGLNLGRLAALLAGLPVDVPGVTVNRFCASGLQSIADGAARIQTGTADVVIAGGAESMSMVPMTGHTFSPNPRFAVVYPDEYLPMGLTAENVAEQFNVGREDQDRFALRSHQLAAAAQTQGRFDEQIVPLDVELGAGDELRSVTHLQDEGVRADASMEALAGLPPVFKEGGSVTAGNSSPMNDGAAALLMMSAERAKQLGLEARARMLSYAVGGVPPEIMGIGPVAAVPKALERAGLSLADLDLIELNEAFASQALAVIRQLGMDMDRVNVNGGAIALGHPLGCSGAKLTTQLVHEMGRRKSRYGLVTMCVGGGMGAAAIFENLLV
ncbi:MAG: thiolase family protein [Chloroflexi bacterium]|nr:thiolase family protein [Chloroflexota bacterium]